MGVCIGELSPRQMESLRVELIESLAAHLAYPPFFDYPSGQMRTRPLDRRKREEIEQYVRSANFDAIERSDVTSTEVRRFLERLLNRYLDVNEVFRQATVGRKAPHLRSQTPRFAAELQRGLIAYVGNNAPKFGARRPAATWSASARRGAPNNNQEHNTRVLEAVLVGSAESPAPAPAPAPRPAANKQSAPPAARYGASWPTGSYDATMLAPAQGYSGTPGGSPFAGLETGQQSSVFGAKVPLSEMNTGPMARSSAVARSNGTAAPTPQQPTSAPRELPPDLYQLYGDYLRDMEPEVAAPPSPLAHAVQDVPTAAMPIPPSPTPRPTDRGVSYSSANGSAGPSLNGNQSDKLIFFQLRYQLEAYVRRAARSYGVSNTSADPSGVLDALRRSGFVDEADLRIAEGILALTDRVTETGLASHEDYRQALMLYLLYHRSHLG